MTEQELRALVVAADESHRVSARAWRVEGLAVRKAAQSEDPSDVEAARVARAEALAAEAAERAAVRAADRALLAMRGARPRGVL